MTSLSRFAVLVALVVACPLVASAQAPQGLAGTWKVNIAKSTYNPGPAPRSQTSVWAVAPGGGWTSIVDGVDAAGRPTHTQQVTMFDGKPVELKGAPVPTMRAFSRVDDRTYQFVDRVNGKVTTTTRVTIAADGKTRTNVATGTNAEGKPVNNTVVWDRQ
jgi:hypothetical protein